MQKIVRETYQITPDYYSEIVWKYVDQLFLFSLEEKQLVRQILGKHVKDFNGQEPYRMQAVIDIIKIQSK